MHLTYEEHDFCGENAARTARIMRAVADVLDPQPVVCDASPADLAALKRTLAQLQPVAFADCGPITPQPAVGTVATHVSAEAVGDVPFPESGGDFTPEQLAAPVPAGVDSEGYPWDERIHASSRNTVADGTWRKKRGVDDALVASVRAEWDAKLRPAPAPAAPTEAERLQADHVSTMPVPWAIAAVPADTIDPAAVGFGTQVPPPPPAAPAAGSDWPDEILGPRTDTMAPFPQFLTWVNRQITAGTLDNARLLEVLREQGVPVITALAAPDHAGKIPAIARQLAGV